MSFFSYIEITNLEKMARKHQSKQKKKYLIVREVSIYFLVSLSSYRVLVSQPRLYCTHLIDLDSFCLSRVTEKGTLGDL